MLKLDKLYKELPESVIYEGCKSIQESENLRGGTVPLIDIFFNWLNNNTMNPYGLVFERIPQPYVKIDGKNHFTKSIYTIQVYSDIFLTIVWKDELFNKLFKYLEDSKSPLVKKFLVYSMYLGPIVYDPTNLQPQRNLIMRSVFI